MWIRSRLPPIRCLFTTWMKSGEERCCSPIAQSLCTCLSVSRTTTSSFNALRGFREVSFDCVGCALHQTYSSVICAILPFSWSEESRSTIQVIIDIRIWWFWQLVPGIYSKNSCYVPHKVSFRCLIRHTLLCHLKTTLKNIYSICNI